MKRFEITGGNGRNASLSDIRQAIIKAGGTRVSKRFAYGWRNQPHVVTFAAPDNQAARTICKKAESILWPDDGSCSASLLAWEY